MDNVSQLLNYRTPNRRTLSLFNCTVKSCSSHVPWSARMFAKVKKCRNVLRDVLTLDKTPRSAEILAGPVYYDVSKERATVTDVRTPRRIPYDSSMPDIVNSTRSEVKNSEWQSIAGINASSLSGGRGRKATSTSGKLEGRRNANYVLNYSSPRDSLQSFLELEKQLKDESLAERKRRFENQEDENDEALWPRKMTTTYDRDLMDRSYTNESPSLQKKEALSSKRKISAEPFFSYAQNSTDLFWLDEDDSPETCENSKYLDTFNVATDEAPRCSTFCEESTKEEHPSLGEFILQDSGFGNNSSIKQGLSAYND